MKIIRVFFIMAVSVGLFSSCVEKLEYPEFNVTATVNKISSENGSETGDAYEVKFQFSGDADNIVFYSGEQGAEYLHRNRNYRNGTVKMQFTTNFSGGNIPNSLRIMLSNDFEPPYTWGASIVQSELSWAVINAATWTDITERFKLQGNRLITGDQATGEAVISEFYQDTPLFIGFWFDADKRNDESLNVGQWQFSNFQIRNEYYDGTSEFYVDNVLNTYWRKLDLSDSTAYTVSANRITLNGNIGKTVVQGEYIPTLWARARIVSPPFYPLLGDADKGLTIKSPDEYLPEYTHTYVNPQHQMVKATFVVTNSLYSKDVQVVKEMEIVFSD